MIPSICQVSTVTRERLSAISIGELLPVRTTLTRNTLYNLALVYEPNPAIQLGVEYTRLYSTYAAYDYAAASGFGTGYSRNGVLNEVRFSAKYSF